MNFKKYLGYNVYENGNVVNSKGIVLKPQNNNNYFYYEISGKRISAGQIVLYAFSVFPKSFKQKVNHIDGNPLNNSLNNLKWI